MVDYAAWTLYHPAVFEYAHLVEAICAAASRDADRLDVIVASFPKTHIEGRQPPLASDTFDL